MVKRTELKPPPEVVDAIRASEDGSTAPPSADISSGPGGFSANTPRAIRNALEHEEPQRPLEIAAAQRGGAEAEGVTASGGGLPAPSHAMQQAIDADHEAGHRFQGAKYDRQHVQAGTAGRGDQAVHSKASIMHHNKQQTNKGGGDKRG